MGRNAGLGAAQGSGREAGRAAPERRAPLGLLRPVQGHSGFGLADPPLLGVVSSVQGVHVCRSSFSFA